jgi:SPOR domain
MADRYQSRPYPTDDDYHRGNEPYSPSVESDPLAELARLIGQTDPFAGAGMSRANVQPQPMAGQQYQPPLEEFEEEQPPAGPPQWMQRANRREVPQPSYPGHGQPAQDYRDRHTYPEQDYPEQNYQADPGYSGTGQSHSSSPYAYPDQDHPGAEHAIRRYPGHPDPVHESHLHEPSFESAAEPLDPSRYDEALFGPLDTDRQDSEYGQAYSDDPYAYQGYGEEAEEEAPKRRGGLTTVVAVLALAVIGTGGAFAYRSYVGSPRSGTPPIIKADTSPTKIIPAAATDGNKAPDRYASADGTEKIVPREETPVDVNANVSSTPRVIFPPPNVSQNQSQPPAASVTQTTPPDVGNGLMPNSQPRKIKTLTVSNDDAGAAAAAAAPVAQPPATKPAAAVRNVRTAPASTADAYANTNAPMSLAPQAIQNVPAPRQQVATNAPEPITPSTTATGYMVQVSSQRNEADAQSSYRVLQGKFPSVLGSHSPTIKRADLGEKGVYYRAMVGPFGSAEEASQFCGSLKSAGGQCVVQRN